jgi:hypothetical protein
MTSDMNRYAPPKAELADTDPPRAGADIDGLDVSASWKQKFHLIEKAGGPKQPKLKALSSGERFKIGFNILAFLFGPFYYLAKGMWKRAFSLFGLCAVVVIVLAVILELLGLGRITRALGYGAAAVFAVRANIDYYKKCVLGDNGWW